MSLPRAQLPTRSVVGGRPDEGPSRYRRDIDGLRALAIALVVFYHVWPGRVSGGVDVFLMVSAYFLTDSLARRLITGQRPGIASFLVRRFAQLLPAAAVTLVVLLAVVWAVFPASMWSDIWAQTWASLFYVQNWELAGMAVDYYARDEATPSPLLHFWSLSIQGQVFLLWPLLIVAVGELAKRAGWDLRAALLVAFSLVFAGSFVYSIIATTADQQHAYFDTWARLWEFALGSLLALMSPFIRLPTVFAAVIGWAGLVGLVLCGAVLDVQGGFPGYLALWPTLCAAAVILSGADEHGAGPVGLLSNAWLAQLAKISYPLYLVHWPVLITWLIISERTSAGLFGGVGVVALSVGLATILTALIERPIRRHEWMQRPRRGLVAIGASVLLVAAPLSCWQGVETMRAAVLEASTSNPGAMVLLPGFQASGDYETIVPIPTALEDEWVVLDGPCTGSRQPVVSTLAEACVERLAPGGANGTVVVVGDSHAQQWMGALLPIAQERGLDVVALLKGGCPFAQDEPEVPGAVGCGEWRTQALQHINRLKPDLVVGMATRSVADDSGEHVLAGLDITLEKLTPSGAQIVLLRDNPRFAIDMFGCVEEEGPDSDECARPIGSVLAPRNPAAHLAGTNVRVIDLTSYLCPQGMCVPVIGGVAVYMDDNHLTGTYARSLSPALARLL